MKKLLFLTVVLASIFVAWSNDSMLNTPVCNAPGSQNNPQIVADGVGGTISVWQDYRSGNADIYAQRLDQNGAPLWTNNGIVICKAIRDQIYPQIVRDGLGGAIITWEDCRGSNQDIYAQRININGKALWKSNGIPVCAANKKQIAPRIIESSAGSVIISWEDYRSKTTDVFVQKISASGKILWRPNGVDVSTKSENRYNHQLVTDNAGGAIIIWGDTNVGTKANHLFGQKFDAKGKFNWTVKGISIDSSNCDKQNLHSASDGTGGVVLTWGTMKSGGLFKSAIERIDTKGKLVWFEYISADTLTLDAPIVSSDKENALVLSNEWGEGNMYISKINAITGNVIWGGKELFYFTGMGKNFESKLISDGAGGAFMAFKDIENGVDAKLYSAWINAAGTDRWIVAFCNAIGFRSLPSFTADGKGGVVYVWTDKRSGTSDIYAQKVSNGVLGN